MRHFVLVERAFPRQSTLHVEHPWEQCNTDDAARVTRIDEETAAAFLASNVARACEFCEPVPDPATLNTRGAAP
jgi:hypothetical protein